MEDEDEKEFDRPRVAPFDEFGPLPLVDLLPKRLPSDKAKKAEIAKILDQLKNHPGEWDTKLIARMKFNGIKKPEWIPDEAWAPPPPHDLQPLNQIAAYMSAWGMKSSEIAKNVGCSQKNISEYVGSAAGRQKIREIQEKIWGRDPKKWIESILPQAIETALEIMLDKQTKSSTRLAAAEGFMDRAMGRATQVIEANDGSLKQVIEALDRMEKLRQAPESAKIIEAEGTVVEEISEAAPAVEETVKDAVDLWVEQNLTEPGSPGKSP